MKLAAISFKDINKLKAWATSSTTITGASVFIGIVGSVTSGAMSWQHALAPAISAIIAMIWPQLEAPTREEIAQTASDVIVTKVVAVPTFPNSTLRPMPVVDTTTIIPKP